VTGAQDISILTHYLAPFRAWLAAPDVTELVVNRTGEVGLEGDGGWRWIAAPELDAAWLRRLAVAAAAFTAQDVSDSQPICSTVLPDGERCQIVLPPAAERLSLTIRKPSCTAPDLSDFQRAGLFERVETARAAPSILEHRLLALREAGDWPAFFQAAVEGRRNILVSGATGSGKTTFAKALIRFIPPAARIVTIEDARELVVAHRNAVHLIYSKDDQGRARVGPKQLLESALRMRPDRILLQELRDASAFFYLRNVNSGHPGSITTIHADSAALAFEQLILLVKESEAGRSLAREDIRALLQQLVDIVVQMTREGGRFRVTEVWYEPVRKLALAA
jgi:type IV secretion system protein VirB11